VRRASAPEGRPGFVRIDSVHQGDFDGIKGLYHIKAVDCVTQWAVVASLQTIGEAYLLPVIEQMLEQFPFEILGFHADNGSEYVNHRVAKMLDKLRVEFTRSRPRHSNDNGLAETKNGALRARRAMDKWTMRLAAHRAQSVDNAHALPTARSLRPLAHSLRRPREQPQPPAPYTGASSTDRLASRRRSQAAPGSNLIWKGLARRPARAGAR
jgi:transposase InsO family protein